MEDNTGESQHKYSPRAPKAGPVNALDTFPIVDHIDGAVSHKEFNKFKYLCPFFSGTAFALFEV